MRHLLHLMAIVLMFGWGGLVRAADREIPLPGVKGRIDHLALDAEGKRLFVAAVGNNSVEVIDLAAGKVAHQIKGLQAPQGIAYAPDLDRLAFASDTDGWFRIYDAKSLKEVAKLDLKDITGSIRYDPATRHFWLGYGSGALAEIDAQTGKQLATVRLDGQPESFQLETRGKRIFVNVPNVGHIAVVDREKHAVIAKWEPRNAAANFPMALDEANQRLFIGCRRPAQLLVMDSENGATYARLNIPADADDVFYDAAASRIYVAGGEGYLCTITQDNANQYSPLPRKATSPGARTALFSPETRQLYVAIPARDSTPASILIFDWARP
jgi:YVTN family beta-propeller protein